MLSYAFIGGLGIFVHYAAGDGGSARHQLYRHLGIERVTLLTGVVRQSVHIGANMSKLDRIGRTASAGAVLPNLA